MRVIYTIICFVVIKQWASKETNIFLTTNAIFVLFKALKASLAYYMVAFQYVIFEVILGSIAHWTVHLLHIPVKFTEIHLLRIVWNKLLPLDKCLEIFQGNLNNFLCVPLFTISSVLLCFTEHIQMPFILSAKLFLNFICLFYNLVRWSKDWTSYLLSN